MNWLTGLYAEQTTPDEVVVFLLLGTFLTLLIAFIAYAVVLLALSRLRMKSRYSIRALLFPSTARIREYAADYAMGTFTAMLLALTVSTKHAAVESVLTQDIHTIGYETVREALPFSGLSEQELVDAGASAGSAEKLASWLADGIARPAAMSAESVVRPLLAAGMTENANLVVQAIVDELGPVANSEILRTALIVAAILLLFGYVLWFGVQRWAEMQKERTTEPGYTTIIKRLSLPAVCIPLLFVSAVALEDSARIVNSAMAAVAVTEPAVEPPLARVITRQAQVIDGRGRSLDASDLDELNGNLRSLGIRLDEAAQRISMLERKLSDVERTRDAALKRLGDVGRTRDAALKGLGDELSRQARETDQALSDLKQDLAAATVALQEQLARVAQSARDAMRRADATTAGLAPLRRDIEMLKADLIKLSATLNNQGNSYGLLLVQNWNGNRSFTVRPAVGNAGRKSGTTIGLYALPPGRYLISGNGAQQNLPRTISIDGVVNVQLQRVIQ